MKLFIVLSDFTKVDKSANYRSANYPRSASTGRKFVVRKIPVGRSAGLQNTSDQVTLVKAIAICNTKEHNLGQKMVHTQLGSLVTTRVMLLFPMALGSFVTVYPRVLNF